MFRRAVRVVGLLVLCVLVAVVSPALSLADKTAQVNAEGESYRLAIHVEQDGTKGTLRIELASKDGFKVNKEFPNRVKADPGDNVTLPKGTLVNEDARTFTEEKIAFDVPYTLTGGEGRALVRVAFRFGVCKLNKAGETVSCQFFTEAHDVPVRN